MAATSCGPACARRLRPVGAFSVTAGVPWAPAKRRGARGGRGGGRPAGAAGTVGAVAPDRHGTMAAATSTGGIAGKLPGRVGDSALIGSGTYADSTLGGVSCTGDGEAIIRVVLARCALNYLKEADDATYAAQVAVDLLVDEGQGHGGVILLDS